MTLPHDLTLVGANVRLEPLHDRHLSSLRRTCNDAALVEFTAIANPFESDDAATAWLDDAHAQADHFPFAIVDTATGNTIGSTRFADIQPANRKIEIGWTFIARDYWRTRVNTECKYVLLQYAFESWLALRVSLKANAINTRSRRAIERIGGTYEGTLRNFRINPLTKTPIDSSYYSIIAQEWPQVKRALEDKLTRF